MLSLQVKQLNAPNLLLLLTRI